MSIAIEHEVEELEATDQLPYHLMSCAPFTWNTLHPTAKNFTDESLDYPDFTGDDALFESVLDCS